MKWDCGPTWQEKKAALEAWHKWFAWRPIMVASHDCRWLETIERKGKYSDYFDSHWTWKYRELELDRWFPKN